MLNLSQAAAMLPGSVLLGDGAVRFERVHTDTRSLQAGDLFVALRGERHDANDMLAEAQARGAAAAICHPGAGRRAPGLPCIEVPDTLQALAALAGAWRLRMELPVIAVTGSNGKTTVTQMLASILRAWQGEHALATQGNLNNHIGVPLTLLRLRAHHRVAVLELGMNHPGEIAGLAALVRPQVALVNNAQREHLEFMGSVEAVARENGAVLSVLPADGVAVFPHDDEQAGVWRTLAAHARQHSFLLAGDGVDPTPARVWASRPAWRDGAWQVRVHGPLAELSFALHQPGLHNVRNALAACTCALAVGAPPEAIRAGLESFTPVRGRSRAMPLLIGDTMHTLIDDSYNANPDSVAAALELLASLPAPRLMVLGDMAEVGPEGEQFHRQAGSLADKLGIEHMFTHGRLSAQAAHVNRHARHFDAMPELIDAVIAELPDVASILVKGSRSMRMERVVEAVASRAAPLQEDPHGG